MQDILPIILAGGAGTRLAPISTPDRPKPFVPLGGGLSLLARTCARINHPAFDAPILIGAAQHRYALCNHARDAWVTPQAMLLEDVSRNTAYAVAAAVAHVSDANAMLAFLPADHWVEDADYWRANIQQLAAYPAIAAGEALGLLGAPTTKHATDYGYIVASSGTGPQPVAQFIEKPNVAPLVTEGQQLLCNLGQFIGRRHMFARMLAQHAPDIWCAAQYAAQAAQTEYEFTRLAAPQSAVDAQPFDRAVLEHMHELYALPAAIGWQDLGTPEAWQAHQVGLALPPTRIERPWGHYTVMHQSASEVQKHLLVYPQCRLSLQRHAQRSEHWQVLAGTAAILHNDAQLQLNAGDEITIEAGSWHRLANDGDALLEIHETQLGAPNEADIERADDDYGRA